MGLLEGHVIFGFCFIAEGLWHLVNHVKLHVRYKENYTSLPWFPAPKVRYLELFLIMVGASLFIASGLFIDQPLHQPLDLDGTIPSHNFQDFEHSLMHLSYIVYAVFAIILDKIKTGQIHDKASLTQLLGTFVFAQELLVIHLHSTHMGVEQQYHKLLQIIVFVTVTTSLMSVGYPKSFILSFVRSISIIFQGIWLLVMGVMVWTPAFTPKGCFLNLEEDGKWMVRCNNDEALERAKGLVNIEFSWYFILVTVFSMCLYLFLIKSAYGDDGQSSQYQKLSKCEPREVIEVQDIECSRK